MNKTLFFSIFFFTIFSAVVFAQIEQQTIDSSGAKCGNGIRETYEPCDRSSNASDWDMCPQIGKILKIAMVCDHREEKCTCQPTKYIICEDKHTTGNELCDPPGPDFCPQVGELMGAKLECNKKTCICKASSEAVFEKPAQVNLTNLSASLCGNRNIDGKEECDPPGRLCTFAGTAGICSDACKCKEVGSDEENKTTKENTTVSESQNVSNVDNSKSSEITAPKGSIQEIIEADSGVSDTTYTVILIIFVILFIISLAVGSYFIFKRSSIGDLDVTNSSEQTKDSIEKK